MRNEHLVRTLIVEDEALVSDMLWTLLETAGYSVAGVASTGRQALELVQTLQPHVIILDLNLPDMNGLEVAHRLSTVRPTPVVIVTAHETQALVTEASAAGVGAFLTKPPNLRELDRAIQITLARFADLQALRQLNASLEARVEARTAELHQANQALLAALRVKDEFLATMSHELRTPLTAVMGLTEALQLKVYGPLTEKQTKALQTIGSSGQHLLHLITDVLDFVQAEIGQLPDDLGPVDVAEVCHASLNSARPAAQKKDLRLTLDLDAEARQLRTDGRHLRRMLSHLLDNAVKFTPAGGAAGLIVTPGTSAGPAPRPEIHFTVWDTGIGIAPAHQGRLFEPFTQLDSRLSRKYEGTGLGLALVRRLAEQHGGRVQVESSGVSGQGSRFTVCLPRVPPGAAPELAPQKQGA